MTVRAVAFDIGGVLELTPPLGITAQWERRLGLAPGHLDEHLAALWQAGAVGAITEQQVHEGIGTLLNLEDAQVDAFLADLWREYLGELNVELTEYFAELRPRYQTAIISNSFVGAREREQEKYGFADLTDLIIYSHEVRVAKPDPRIYEMTWTRLDVAPEEMVFVDDHEPNVVAARRLGIHAILHQDNTQTIAELTARLDADHVTGLG